MKDIERSERVDINSMIIPSIWENSELVLGEDLDSCEADFDMT